VIVQDVQHVVEEVIENVNARQDPAYLSGSDVELSDSGSKSAENNGEFASRSPTLSSSTAAAPHSPKLALSRDQAAIIDSLNAMGIKRYPVHIQKHRHSHAAIIVRKPKDGFREGKIVMKHWMDNEFVV
jgi:hypothetical protein